MMTWDSVSLISDSIRRKPTVSILKNKAMSNEDDDIVFIVSLYLESLSHKCLP
jgi:hypothetical protein